MYVPPGFCAENGQAEEGPLYPSLLHAGQTGDKRRRELFRFEVGILGLMKSAALEFGQYNITVNALIPSLVDTPLTRYETRLVESMGETGHKPPDHPTPQEAWDVRAPTVPLKVGWLQPDDISTAAVFLASMQQTW